MSEKNNYQLIGYLIFFFLIPLFLKALKKQKKAPVEVSGNDTDDDFYYEDSFEAKPLSPPPRYEISRLDDAIEFGKENVRLNNFRSKDLGFSRKRSKRKSLDIKKAFFKSKRNLKKAVLINEILSKKEF
jgi:hypothetical protein